MNKRVAIVRLLHYPEDKLVQREAHALHEAGFDVDIFCTQDGQPAYEVIDGIHVHRAPLERIKGGWLRNLLEYAIFFCFASWHLTVAHLRRPFAAIQVNTMPDFLVFATLIPRLMGARIILQMYEPMPELWATRFQSRLLIGLLKQVEQWSIRYADVVLTVTEQIKNRFVSRGANPEKITVILNVPDAKLFNISSSVAAATAHNDEFVLICHGAIEERYGHDTMLQAIDRIKTTLPNVRLHITGQGSYEEQFKTQIREMHLEKQVRFLGYVSFAQLVQELSRADVGIVAQKSSPYSNLVHTGKMYDLMAFGKPVIVSSLDAIRAYFDEQSVCFFEPGNPDDLARAIIHLYHHPEQRQNLVANATRLYKQYHWENQKKRYWAVYKAAGILPEFDKT